MSCYAIPPRYVHGQPAGCHDSNAKKMPPEWSSVSKNINAVQSVSENEQMFFMVGEQMNLSLCVSS